MNSINSKDVIAKDCYRQHSANKCEQPLLFESSAPSSGRQFVAANAR